MIYRSSKREFDVGVLVFAWFIILIVIVFVMVTVSRSAEYEHIEKMEQIKTCKEEE